MKGQTVMTDVLPPLEGCKQAKQRQGADIECERDRESEQAYSSECAAKLFYVSIDKVNHFP